MAKTGYTGPNIQIISLPQPAHHALQGMIHLALRPRGEACLALDAARARRLPAGALAKTFQKLARSGLLKARRGPGGGYELAREARLITAARIVGAVSDPGCENRCLMRDGRCGADGQCALHRAAVKADGILRARLESLTLADLAALEHPAPNKKKGGRA